MTTNNEASSSSTELPAARMSRMQIGGVPLGVISVPEEPHTWPEGMTEAEREISLHLIRGHEYRHIAAVRGVSEQTVSAQVSAVMRKLGVNSAAKAVAILGQTLRTGTHETLIPISR